MTDTNETIARSDLLNFISATEEKMFRTASDVGANANALQVWNRVRAFAGLPPLTMEVLREKAPEVAELVDLKQRWREEENAFHAQTRGPFLSFPRWLCTADLGVARTEGA